VALIAPKSPVLELLTEVEREALLGEGTERWYEAGERVVAEGDASSFVVVILSGWVVASVVTERGGQLILAIRGTSDIVGDLAAIDGGPRSATLSSIGRTRTMIVSGDRFRHFLVRFPRANRVLLRVLGARLRDSDRERQALVSFTLIQRLARLLIELADRGGIPTPEGVAIDISLAQQDLAASVGATREGAARALRVLRESGAICTGPRRVVVARRELLYLLGAGSGNFSV